MFSKVFFPESHHCVVKHEMIMSGFFCFRYMGSNEITSIPTGFFANNINLQVIYLTSNNLTHFGALTNQNLLQTLGLADNKLETIDYLGFSSLPALSSLYACIFFNIYSFPKQALVLTCLPYKPFKNTEGKGEIACFKQFLFFPQCFLPLCHFYQI